MSIEHLRTYWNLKTSSILNATRKRQVCAMGIDYKLSGSRIRAVRNARGVTARKLASLVGISVDSLLHVESGSRHPGYQTVHNIAVAPDASIDYISGHVDRPDQLIPTPIIEEQGLSNEQAELYVYN